jgi:peptidoglycan/LPS O-acetylase OafA/YrhL
MRHNDPPPPARQWTNVVLIAIGLFLVGISAWVAILMNTPELRAPDIAWAVYAAAGALTLIAVLIAQRRDRRRLAQGLLLAACAVLVLGAVSYRAPSLQFWLTIVLPALALLVTVPFVGPMPRAAS